MMRRMNVAGWLFVVFVALLVEAGVRAFDYEQSIATPSSTLRALYDELAAGTLSGEIGDTLSAYFQGLALAIVIGVAAGVLIGSSRTMLDASSVVIEFLRPIPAVALIPLAIVFFGTSASPRTASSSPMRPPGRSSSTPSMASAAPTACSHDVARISGVGRTGRLFSVTLPAALPEHRHRYPG